MCRTIKGKCGKDYKIKLGSWRLNILEQDYVTNLFSIVSNEIYKFITSIKLMKIKTKKLLAEIYYNDNY